MIKEYSDAIQFEDDYNCYDFDIINFIFSDKKLGKGYIITLPIHFSVELEEFFKTVLQYNSIISFKVNNDSTIIAINSF